MPTPRAPWTVKLLEVLADGRWHTVDELVDTAGPLVPPGRAARVAESRRAWQSELRNGTRLPRVKATDTAHDVGRRCLVVTALHGLRIRGVVEKNDRRYRLAKGAR